MTLPKPEKITEKNLKDALGAGSDLPASDDPDFKELVALAGKELMSRFNTAPDSLPGTFVIKLYLDGMKAIAAGDAPDQGDPGSVDLLGSFDALPPETALPLIKAEMTRLAALWHEYEVVRERMEGPPT